MASDLHAPTLGEVVSLVRGTTYKSALLGQPGPVLLGLGSIQRNGGFRDDSLKTYGGDSAKKLVLSPGDLFVSLKDVTQSGDLLGAIAQIPNSIEAGRLTQDTVKLDFGDSQYPQDLLYWTLRTPQYRAYCRAHATGTTNLGLSREDFLAYRLPAPTRGVLSIVKALGALDEKIELNRRQNETLDEMARALFKAWFVDFEPVRAKMEGRWQRGRSLPGLPEYLYDVFPDRLVESELGEIPDGWDVSTLGVVCAHLNRGISPKYVDLGGVLVLNQKCIRDYSIDFSKARRHDVTQRKIDGRALEWGDVLVNSTGVGTLGRVAQVRRLAETTIVDSHVTVVRSGARINPMYLGGFMSMKQPEIEAMGEGSTGQTELSRKKLGDLKILLPKQVVLDQFAKQSKTFSESIAVNHADSETLSQLRDTLLPKLISGELRVPDAERIIGAAV